MDPVACQGVVRTCKTSKAIRRALLQVPRPISVISFLFCYYSSCLPCFIQSIKRSFTTNLGHFISKKAFFLLSNFILLCLAIDFNLCGSSAFTYNLCDEHFMRFGNHLPSQSDVIPAKQHIVEEKIVMEQSFTNNIYDDLLIQDDQPPLYEKYRGDATSGVRTLDVFQVETDADKLNQGRLTLYNQPCQLNSAEVEDVVDEKNTVESTRDLEVVVVKEVIKEEVKLVSRKDEFELLSMDELNYMFEEFIKREKREKIGSPAACNGLMKVRFPMKEESKASCLKLVDAYFSRIIFIVHA